MRRLRLPVLVALFLALFAGSASALVTFDSSTGRGFVGKGDVQTVFGWNNATTQQNHMGVTFKYEATTEYEFECEWYTGPDRNRKHHVNTKTERTNVNAAMASDSRKTGQWTGWNLNGFSGGTPNAVAEPTDADCGSEGNEMKTIVPGSIQKVSESSALYAVHSGAEKRIWP